MSDPLTEIVGLLKPSAPFSKLVLASGAWAVRRPDDGRLFYAALLEGSCRLAPDGREPLLLGPGDFVLVPAAQAFTSSSLEAPARGAESEPAEESPGVFRLGGAGRPDTRMMIGHCAFGSHDAHLLVSLLPRLVHVQGRGRLTTLAALLDEEARARRPGRDAVLARLLEVLLIEAFRATGPGPDAPPGLLRGLADERLAAALRRIHDDPTRAWTVAELARAASLSRSTFFERFRRELGTAPMEYLLAWRMALAKDMLRREGAGVGAVAERVGYGSASTFSAAFARHVGQPPIVYAREHRAA